MEAGMAKQQKVRKPAQGPMVGGIVRSAGPQNRQKPEEEQAPLTDEQVVKAEFDQKVRAAAKTGKPYGEIIQQFGLKNLNALYAIIEPDVVQKVDPSSFQLIDEDDEDDDRQ
jgi:hypothetical protein